MNKALCIFNSYENEPACQEWGKLFGTKRDLKQIKILFEKDYDLTIKEDVVDIMTCVNEYLKDVKKKNEKVKRLHFLFSGHGVYNQELVIDTDDAVDTTIKCPTPMGECIVGNEGKLCSIRYIQGILANMINPDKIVIMLDCCQSLTVETKLTHEQAYTIQTPDLFKIKENNWKKMATIQATCFTREASDGDSMVGALFNMIIKDGQIKNRILIRKMDKLVNEYWENMEEEQKDDGVKASDRQTQRCKVDILRCKENWENEYWPM